MDTNQSAMQSPEEVWRGFDPEALPLDIEVIKSWQEDGCAYEKLRFTGAIAEGFKTRVFAIQGAPVGGKNLPGILHIHGGGQTANLDWVKFWAKRGYVCVSFDFCGPWQTRTEFTEWGPIKHANMAEAAGGFQVHPTPRESSWYHWAAAGRRALTLLTRHPAADPSRLGIYGISVGGNLTSMVAGSDKRVKAAVAIYGSGYNYDRGKTQWGFGEQSADLAIFQRALSPEAHAPYVTCPLLHLDATNDFHAWMDYSDWLLGAMPALTRQAFTPYFNHHIEPEQGANLPLWMDWHLRGGKPFPASPKLKIELDSEGVPSAKLEASGGQGVQRVDIFYGLGSKQPPARFWRRVSVSKGGKGWEARLPVADTWEPLCAFANVLYKSGVSLTSNLAHCVPARVGKAKSALEWSARLENGSTGLEHWYFTAAYTDPNITSQYLQIGEDGSRRYVTLKPDLFGDPMRFSISSHIVGDPGFQGQDGMTLVFDCKGEFNADGLTVNVIENDWGPRSKTYTTKIKPEELSAEWKTIALPLSRFVSQDGKTPASWKVLDKVELSGQAAKKSPPCFAGFHWAD